MHNGQGASVHDNYFEDNTDIDLVVGGGPGAVIQNNNIQHFAAHGFGGIHVGYFAPHNGDHSGSTYGPNTVGSSVDQLAFGVIVGIHPWDTTVSNPSAGTVQNNNIQGAVVNLAVDGIGDGTVTGNATSIPQGTNGYGCTIADNYTSAHFGVASLQPGADCRWYHNGQCGCP